MRCADYRGQSFAKKGVLFSPLWLVHSGLAGRGFPPRLRVTGCRELHLLVIAIHIWQKLSSVGRRIMRIVTDLTNKI